MPQTLSFEEEKNGYSKSQVDVYLESVLGEYERISHEYKSLEEKHSQLERLTHKITHEKNAASGLASNYRIKISQLQVELEQTKKQSKEHPPEFAGEVARVLMDAEVLAGKIIERAKEEEAHMNDEARAENERLSALKEQLEAELKVLWERLRYDGPD